MINSTFYFVNNNFQYVANLNKNSYDFPQDFQVTKKPINSFLTDYKSINELQNKEAAYKVIEDSIKMYNEHFPKKHTHQS